MLLQAILAFGRKNVETSFTLANLVSVTGPNSLSRL